MGDSCELGPNKDPQAASIATDLTRESIEVVAERVAGKGERANVI